jgi:ribosomal protein S30
MPSHGSLSKAGKVRMLTSKPSDEEEESTPTHGPKINNRKAYRRRIVLNRNAGRYGTQGGQYEPRRR